MNPILGSGDRLCLDEALRLDKICDRFETAWKSGLRPRLEEFLQDQPEPARQALLCELLQVELSYRQQADEQPTLDEYRSRFPQEAELLAVVFAEAAALAAPAAQPLRSLNHAGDRPKNGWYSFQEEFAKVDPPPAKSPGGLSTVAGHELLEVLGQGGMGTVYKARHRKLNRLVAVKMVRSDCHAGPETLARFRTEAEAVARLQHPNIVPIYEVGENHGLPFFSMEFVGGGSLAQKLAHQPQPARPAAELVELLAQAMHYAHQSKIVHRDLKPHNVLLTEDGTPKITDFGLAKLLDRDTAQTQSGQFLGTPQYMAPEQAAGKPQQIGPATDVYALGVILYEMLTGRPPFCGSDAAIIMAQVIDDTPVPPRRLVPTVPRDLETICLMCLEKEPRKRYASALDLAEDLRRLRNGESILARPTPHWERTWKWVKRRPALASASGVLLVALLAGGVGHYLAQKSALDDARADERRARAAESEANDHAALVETRAALEGFLRVAEAAREKRDWKTAQLQAERAQTQAGDDPRLNDLRGRADQLLAQVEQRINVQDCYTKSGQSLDDARFYTTQFTGLDKLTNLKQARDAAVGALARYGVNQNSSTAPNVKSDYLSESQQCEIMAGCYELLLIWADADAQLADPTPRASAERALVLLNLADRFEFDTQVSHHQRARYLDQLGDALGAAWQREIAKQSRKANAIDFFLRGIDAYRDGKPKQAIEEFARVLSLQPDHYGALYSLAVCHLTLSSSDRASERAHLTAAKGNLNGCISRRPDRIWPYLLRGYAHGELDEFEAAEADFQKAEELNPDEVARYGILVNRGAMRIRHKKLAEAIQDLRTAIKLKPDQLQARAWLARAFQAQSQFDEAVLELDKAIALKQPVPASLYRDRAKLHLQRNDSEAALRDLDQAIQLESAAKPSPVLADDHLERGLILHRAKQYPEAVRAYEDALRLHPDYLLAHRLKGEALLQLNRHKEAVQALDHFFDPYVQKEKSLAVGYRLRGQAYARLNKHVEAVADFTRALEIEPEKTALYAARGWAYVMLDANKLAVVDFVKVIELEPKNADGYNGRGYARVKLGQYSDAVGDAEEALRRPPVTYQTCYKAARILAQAADQVEKDTRPSVAWRGKRLEYQDRAVQLLRRSHDLQRPEERKAFWQYVLYHDAALVPINNCTGFIQLARQYSRPKIPMKPEAIQ